MGKYNKLWILVLALLVCLAMGLSGCVTTGPQNEQTEPSQGINDPVNGPGEVINSDQTASDKETLIRLLAAQGEFTITLEKDIKLDAPVAVYGSKTLVGDKSIAMELWVPQYQHILVVKKGASLTLDGATIDGNAAASCVKVEAGAKMALRSGEIIWGCPYGIEAYGDVEITGGAIRETANTGLYLRSGANGVMDGGKIIDGSYTGVKIEKAATMRISDDAVLVNNKFTLVWNNGKCDITGGEMHDGGTYLAYNFGDMTVKYTGSDANGKLEWYNAGAHLISQGKTGSLSLEGVHLKNSGWHGISSAIGSANIQLKDVVIDDVVQAALYLRCGATVENVEVNNCGTAGVYVGNGSTVGIKNLSVNGSGGRGIWNFGGNVTASDVTITNARDFGITSTYWEGQSGFLTVSNLTIDGVERDHAISANNSPITVIGGTVKNVQSSNKVGAYAISGGTLTLKDVAFSDVVYASVYVQGANSSASLENITITGGKRGVACYDTGKLTGKHVVINETEEYAVACSNVGSVVELDHVQINNCKFSTRGAVNVGSSTVKLSNAKIVKSAGNGIDINENGYLTLNNVTITDAGICGINVIGGNVVGENVTIQSPVRYGIYAQKEKDVVGSTKINGLTIDTTGDMGVSANGTVMEIVGGSIKNAGKGTTNKCAGYVINGGKLTMKGMEITDTAYVGVYCENDGSYCYVEDIQITGGQRGIACYDGTVEGKNIVINDTASYAIASSRAGSKVDITGLEINNCKHTAGSVNVGGSNVTLTDVTILKPAGNGIDINENGVLTLTNATITEPGGCGLNIIGGNVTGDNVTITSAGNYGIYAQKEKEVVGKTQITGLTIDTTANMAISINGAEAEITDATIQNAGKGTTNKCAAYVIGGGKLTLKDAQITDTAYAGVYVENSGSYGCVEDVTITGGQRGIVCYDGTVEGKAVTITRTTSFSITSSRATSKITLTDVTVTNCANSGGGAINVGGSVTELTNLILDGAAGHGINVDGGKLTLKGAQIKNVTKWNGINVNGGTVTAADVTNSNVKYNGIELLGSSTVTVDGLTVTGAGHNGVLVTSGIFETNNVNISGSSWHGIHVAAAGELKINSATFANNTLNPIFVEGGKATGENITIDSKVHGMAFSGGTADLKDVTIHTAGGMGVNIYNSATVTLSNLIIKKATTHGINIEAGSKLTLNGSQISNITTYNGIYANGGTVTGSNVTITNPKYNGIEVLNGGSVTLDGVTITGAPRNSVLITKGLFDGKNVNISGSGWHGIHVSAGGELKISGATFANNTLNPIFVEGGKATGGDITIDSKTHGMSVSGGTVDLSDVTINTASGNGVNIYNGANVTFTNLIIKKATTHGINLEAGSKLTLNGAQISNIATYNGIYVNGGTLTGGDVTITNPKYNGIEVLNGGSATVDGLTVTGAPRNGVLVTKGLFDGKNVKVSGSGYHGIQVSAEGELKIDGAELTNCSMNGLFVQGGKVTGGNITTDTTYHGVAFDGGNVTLEGVSVKNTAHVGVNGYNSCVAVLKNVNISNATDQAVKIHASANVTIDGLTIDGCKSGNAAVYVQGAAADISNATFSNISGHGFDAESGAVLKLDGIVVNSPKLNGIYVAGGDVSGIDVTINAPSYHGLAMSGGKANIEKLTVNDAGSNGVKIYDKAEAELTDLTVKNTKAEHGVNALTGTTLKLNGATITGCKLNAIFAQGAAVTGSDVTADGAYNGLSVDGGNVTLDGLNISNVTNIGVTVYNKGTADLSDLTVNTAKVHGINVETGSKLTLDGAQISNITTYNGIYANGGTITGSNVTITNPKYNGIEVLNGGSVTLDGVTITGAPRNGVLITKGLFDGKNVNISGSGWHGIHVPAGGELKISGATFANNAMNPIFVEGGKATGDNITIDSKTHGMSVSGGTVDLSDVTINTAGGMGVNIYNSANVTLSDLTIKAATTHGINIETGSKLTLNGAQISNIATYNGIYANGGTVTGSNVTVTNPKYNGIHALNSATVNLDGVTVTDANKNGVLVEGKANVTIKDLTVTNSKTEHGVNVQANSYLTLNGTSTITKSALNAIFVKGGTLNGGGITTDSSYHGLAVEGGNVTLDGLTVKNANKIGVSMYSSGIVNLSNVKINTTGEQAVKAYGSANVTINGLQIDNCKSANAAIFVDSATVDLSNVTIQNFVGTAHGINLKTGTLKLNGVTVTGAKLNGIFVEGGTVTGGTVTIQSPAYYGLAASGGSITLSDLKVFSAARWAVNLYGKTTATLQEVEVNGTGWEAVRIGESASLTLTNASLKNWKTTAVKNETSGTYTPTNVTTQ